MNNITLAIVLSSFLLQNQLAACQGFRQIGCMVVVRYFSREFAKTCLQNQSKDTFKNNKKKPQTLLEIYREINGPLPELLKNSEVIVHQEDKNNRKIK